MYMCIYICIYIYAPGLSYDHFGVSKFETPNCTPPLDQGNERSAGNKPPNRTYTDIVSVSIHPSTSFHILPHPSTIWGFPIHGGALQKKTPFIASIVHKPSVAPGRPEGSPEERRSLRGHRVQGLGRPISNPRHRRHHETSVVVTYKMYKEREEKHGKNG